MFFKLVFALKIQVIPLTNFMNVAALHPYCGMKGHKSVVHFIVILVLFPFIPPNVFQCAPQI